VSARAWILAGLVPAVLAGCGGGGGKTVSSSSLKPRLLPSIGGLRFERNFDWRDPVDLVGQGIAIPQATAPSAAVKEFVDAGYRGGAGVAFTPRGQPEPETIEAVTRLGSPAGARKVLRWLHQQDLQQPCFSQCIFQPRAIAITGVPGAAGVAQVPGQQPPPAGARKLPSGAGGPQTNLIAEFTIGPYLYYARTQAAPRDQPRFVAGVRLAYARAKRYASS
jgi:hypothetical protein